MENLLLLPSGSQNKVRKASYRLNKINNDFKEYEAQYKSEKEELQKVIKDYADKNNLEEFGVKNGNSLLKIKPIIQRKITWDIGKLSERLDKETLNKIVTKEYYINDFKGLVKYLKSCGVDPKKFKKFIDVNKKVDNKKVDELGQLNELNIEDLSGCYELQANFSYIKISELEDLDAED